ncbi:MAG: methionyl-tRNA formyltransferase, partial [Polyangiaceae bacterium]
MSKIAFFGLPLAALLLRADDHEIAYAGICRKDAIGNRRLARTAACPVELVPNLTSAKTVATIERASPDLIVSWFWTKKIPRHILAIPKLGAIGVHPSLLPRHRGPDPYFWAIASGDRETGVTAHRLDEEYDTGEVIDQVTLAIDPKWNAWTLAKKLDRPSLELLRRVVKDIARTDRIESRPQSETGATDAPAPSDDDLLLSFDAPAEEIVRRVRAAGPWPGAFFDFGGRLVTVTRAHVA